MTVPAACGLLLWLPTAQEERHNILNQSQQGVLTVWMGHLVPRSLQRWGSGGDGDGVLQPLATASNILTSGP